MEVGNVPPHPHTLLDGCSMRDGWRWGFRSGRASAESQANGFEIGDGKRGEEDVRLHSILHRGDPSGRLKHREKVARNSSHLGERT